MTSSMRLILLLGLVSLFADVTYEGARSVIGPYLSGLGASGLVIGLISGAGEWVGYGFRLLSGSWSDATRRYWLLTFIGYLIALVSIPLLAFAFSWQIAAVLVIAERLGKALRSPPRDALLSYATHRLGRGWGFGIHEALDQVGAILGPLIVLAIQISHGSYRLIFALLSIPAAISLFWLIEARLRFPQPQEMEAVPKESSVRGTIPRVFWIYVIGASLVALGFMNYPLIAFHLIQTLPSYWIPLLYALAMGVSSLAALMLGKLFDRYGMIAVMGATALSSFFAPLVLLTGKTGMIVGMILWGIGLGSQESIFRAAVSQLIAPSHRGKAYGILNFSIGIFWFIGSASLGFLLDRWIQGAVLISMFFQMASLPFFFKVFRYEQNAH